MNAHEKIVISYKNTQSLMQYPNLHKGQKTGRKLHNKQNKLQFKICNCKCNPSCIW